MITDRQNRLRFFRREKTEGEKAQKAIPKKTTSAKARKTPGKVEQKETEKEKKRLARKRKRRSMLDKYLDEQKGIPSVRLGFI